MTESGPFLSVVTVTRNAGAALAATGRSVAEQAGVTLEHVVQDGLSTDGSVEAFQREFPAARVTREADGGIYDAMNRAAARCRGRYVHFVNCGDLYAHAGAAAALARAAQAAGEPDLLVVWLKNLATGAVRPAPPRITPWFLYRTALSHQAVVFRRDVLAARTPPHDTSLKILADHDLIFRCLVAERRRHVVVPETLVLYEGTGFSAAASREAAKDAEAAEIRRRHFPASRRAVYAAAHALTLPRLRRRVLRGRSGDSALARAYHALSARINRGGG